MILQRIEARAAAAVARAVERRAKAIAESAEQIAGITVDRDSGRVVLSGRGLARRSIDELLLRFVTRAR